MIAADNPKIPSIKPYKEEEFITQIFQFKKDLLLWGSPKVISAILEFENSAKNNSPLILASINNLYQSMREDIGLSNKKLKKHELIKIFLSDPEEVEKLIQNSEKV